MDESKVSVRDKRKAETLSLIHTIAQRVALEKGLGDMKIDEVAEAAGVSRRTFFNYYATKEDAVLGFRPPELTDESIARFTNSQEDILTRIVWLVVDVIRTTAVPGSSGNMRKKLRKRFPVLMLRFDVRTIASEEIIRRALFDNLDNSSLGLSKEDIEILLGLARAIIKYAYTIDSEIKDGSIKQAINTYKSTIRKTI